MKIITWLLLVCFTSQVMAQGLRPELNRAIEEFNYEVTVEWDQKDQSFYSSSVKRLQASVKSLLDSGLTTDDLKAYLQSIPNGQKVLDKLTLKQQLLGRSLEANELMEFIQSETTQVQSTGASWNGDAGRYVVNALIVAAVIGGLILLLTSLPTGKCVQYEEVGTYQCDVENFCVDYECTTYEQRMSCGYEKKCLVWEKTN